MSSQQPDVIVIGAGVIGLSTGICLAEQGLRVTAWTRDDPSRTTSAVASAMVGPSLASPHDPAGARERVGIAEFTALADVDRSGVTMRRGRLISRQAGSPPGLHSCAAAELPPGYRAGSWANLPLVDMPVYLDYLVGRFVATGGTIQRREVRSLREPAEQAPLIVNCSGLGARELVPDPAVRPVRGQQVVVDNPGIEEFFISAPFEPDWTAYWPYRDHVILGGTLDEDDESSEPDPDVAARIIQRCSRIEPRLGNASVLRHQVGLRPARPTVRLEAEQFGTARCVHNYGHGGSGVTLSWGCAREAAALLTAQGVQT